MKKISMLILSALALMSCEKEIELDLNSADPKIVIEGQIPQNQTAKIIITKTVNISDTNVFPAVRAASVSITDNLGNIEQLVETSAGVYQTQKMIGAEGRIYTLSVNAEGKNYTAKTTMPSQVKLVNIKTLPSTFSPPGQTNDNFLVYPVFTDPEAFGNNYRFIQATDKAVDKAIIVTNDNVGNGQPFNRPIISQDFDIILNDKLTLEMQCIDKVTYDYFYSLNAVNGNGPGGGTTPTNPVTNITGGALGYFSAHTVQKMTVIVK